MNRLLEDSMLDQQTSREAFAEFIGTFMLVLIGAGSVVLAPPSTGALIPALAHGLILVAIIGTYGHISGAYVNPAVTLAVWIANKISSQKLGVFMLAQFMGGLVAAVVLLIVLPTPGQLGQTTAAPNVNELDIILVEGILTFFLASVVLQAAVYDACRLYCLRWRVDRCSPQSSPYLSPRPAGG
jgi:aquaporin Z